MTNKELFSLAVQNLKEFTTLKKPDFRLEQIEFIEKENVWEIIVSFLVENTNKRLGTSVGLITSFEFSRKYKKVRINNNKVVLGIYIYNYK